MRTRRPICLLALPVVAVAALAACGGDGDPSAGGGVATLPPTTAPAPTTTLVPTTTSTDDDTGTVEPDAVTASGDGAVASAPADTSGPSSDPQEAMLDYAACMRDNGVDMPDPEFTEDGGMMMSMGAAAGEGPDPEEYEAAHEACEHFMEAARSNIEVDPERQAEMQEQMLEFAQCMRDHGIDMPDPEFGEDGGVSIQVGGPNDEEAGPRSDEEFAEASEACGQEGGALPALAVEEAG